MTTIQDKILNKIKGLPEDSPNYITGTEILRQMRDYGLPYLHAVGQAVDHDNFCLTTKELLREEFGELGS